MCNRNKLVCVGVIFAMANFSCFAGGSGVVAGNLNKTTSTSKVEIFSPEFSAEKFALPNLKLNRKIWSFSDNTLRILENTTRCSSFRFGNSNWCDYELEFRVKRLKINPKDQHFGVIVRSSGTRKARTLSELCIYCRGSSIFFREIKDNKETRHYILGNLPKAMGVGVDATWTSFRIIVKAASVGVYADGRLIGTVSNVLPKNGGISFYAYNLNLFLDNLKVLLMKSLENSSKKSDVVKNILHNSSFEQCTLDKLPDYWGCTHWGITDPYWVTHFDKWAENYGVDDSVHFEGKRSMRIHNPFDKPNSEGLLLRSVTLGTKKNKKYLFSAYLKSAPAGMKVNFNGRTISLSDKWKRYTTSFFNDGNSPYHDMLNVYPLGKGTFWIDAAQLEEGEKATPYHRSFESPALQTQEGNQEKKISTVPQLRPPYFNKSIKLDGKLDDPVWNNVEKIGMVTLNGAQTSEKTETQIWYNDKGMYLGIKCFDDKASKNKCESLKHDAAVWNDPSIELFVDPNLTRNYYYHMAFNQIGAKADAYCGDMSWNPQWSVAVSTDPKGEYWCAEVFLPFGEMGINRATGDWWGLNVCRNNKNRNEYDCWSPTYAGYHTPERFGQIFIDEKVRNKYCFDCGKLEFKRGTKNNLCFSVEILNNSSISGNFLLKAELTNAADKSVCVFKRPIALATGDKKTIEIGELNAGADEKYSVRLLLSSTDGKDLLYSVTKQVETPSCFQITPQYGLYTNESKMRLIAHCNLNNQKLKGGKLEIAICNLDGKSLITYENLKLAAKMNFNIDIQKLPQGEFVLKSILKNGEGKTLASAQSDIWKLPPEKNEVKIDHFRRMITVDGKPFIPLGFAWEGPLTEKVMEYLSKNGCNTISYLPHFNYAKMEKVLNLAQKYGIKIKPAISAKDKSTAIKFIEHFKKYPAILAWDIFDEVFTGKWGKEHYDFINSCCQEIKKIDPFHPVFINENQYGLTYLYGKNLAFPGDIVSIDYYAWTPSGNFPVTGDYVKLMSQMGRKKKKPCWIYLLGAGYAFWASRDYTPAEHEFSAYTSIINGATGIFYFASHPKSPSSWNRVKRILREIDYLTPIIASSPLDTSSIKCAEPSIQFLVRKSGKSVWVIAVNSSKKSIKANFDLSSVHLLNPSDKVSVEFENRDLEIKNSMLLDEFKGFQRHVYRIEVARSL